MGWVLWIVSLVWKYPQSIIDQLPFGWPVPLHNPGVLPWDIRIAFFVWMFSLSCFGLLAFGWSLELYNLSLLGLVLNRFGHWPVYKMISERPSSTGNQMSFSTRPLHHRPPRRREHLCLSATSSG